MATKLTLDRAYLYAGTVYGPGEAEIEDDEAAEAVQQKVERQRAADLDAARAGAPAARPAPVTPEIEMPPVDGVYGSEIGSLLRAGGFDDPEEVARAEDARLLDVEGIGPARLKQIRAVRPQEAAE